MILDHRAGTTIVTVWGVGLLATVGLDLTSFVGELVRCGGVAKVSEVGLYVCCEGAVSLTSGRHAARSMNRKTASTRPLLRGITKSTSEHLVADFNIG